MSHKQEIAARLQAEGIPHQWFEHQAVFTMEECLRLPYAAPDVTFCKNILLCNRQQTQFFLYVTLPDKPFRTADVSKKLNSSRLSFAPADALPRLLGLQSGSLSPLAMWFDSEGAVTLALDRAIRRPGRIAFHPCDSSATVIFDQDVFFERVLPLLGDRQLMVDA